MKKTLGIIEQYKSYVVDLYMTTHPDANVQRVATLMDGIIKDNFKDIPCIMHNNIKDETINTTIVNVFNWIQEASPIITGNGTFFMQHKDLLSPVIPMLEELDSDRGAEKKVMYSFLKGTIEYINAMISQMSIKVIMNADYGGSGTPLSPFYSCYIPPATTGTAKNITTSLICCLEFLSGNKNRWVKLANINELYDLINIVLTDQEERNDRVYGRYTPEEVGRRLIEMVNDYTVSDIKILLSYLKTLRNDQLSNLMLAFNIKLVLSEYVDRKVAYISEYFKMNQFDINCITEENLMKWGFGVKAPPPVYDEIKELGKIINDTCVYPFILNDAETRAWNMERIIVCVTDTDSLMLHFPAYLKEFQSNVGTFKASCLVATALGTRLFVEHIIPKFVNYIALGCNIEDEYYRSKFIFKNEFSFLEMCLVAKKMYASSMFVQEGSPRDPHEIAVSGLSFKKRDAAEFLEPIMLEIYDKYILTSDEVNLGAILDKFYELRNQLMTDILETTEYYQVLGLKDVSAYKKSKTLPAQMRGSLVWNALMADEQMLSMDRVKVITLSWDLLHQYANTDPMIADVLRLNKNGNDDEHLDPVICLPEHYHTIPSWIRPVIDVQSTVDKLLLPFKQIFETFDLYIADTPTGMIPSRMIYT